MARDWGRSLARAKVRGYAWAILRPGSPAATPIDDSRKTMKDVKVDVRVNVGVDAASVILLLASAATALFLYKQHREDKLKLAGS
jgi:hypothetical protein